MRYLHCLLSAAVLTSGMAYADETDTAKAKGALALAKAKREREHDKTTEISAMNCYESLADAEREAEKSGKRLVLWVGVTCKDHPQLRQLLDAAVHCHLDKWRGDDEPRIVIRGGDGQEYFVYPAKMTDEAKTAENVKKVWAKTYVPPPDPPKRAGISEELGRKTKIPDARNGDRPPPLGSVPVGEVAFIAWNGSKIIQGNGFRYDPDFKSPFGNKKAGDKVTSPDGSSGEIIDAVAGREALRMAAAGSLGKGSEQEYYVAYAKSMMAWEDAGKPGGFVPDIDRPLSWRHWEHVKAMQRDSGTKSYSNGVLNSTDPEPPPPEATDADWALYRKYTAGGHTKAAKAAPCELCANCDCGTGCVCDREADKRKAGGMASRSVGETIVQVPPAYYTMPVYYTMPQPAPSRSVGIGAGFNVGRFGASVGACIGGG